MQIDLYDNLGNKKGKINLSKEIFEADINVGLIHRALIMQQSNGRQVSAKTKTRGEVRGGGRKPWRQKGTGRARSGSIRNPIWRGGGITFGPTGEQNYTVNMPKKQRRKALFAALSQRASESNIIALEDIKGKEMLKTKTMSTLMELLPIKRTALVVVPKGDKILKKVLKNIPYITFVESGYLNTYDLLKNETLIFIESSITEINNIWKVSSKELYKKNENKVQEKGVKITKKINDKKDKSEKIEKPVVKKATVEKTEVKKSTIKKTTIKKDNKK